MSRFWVEWQSALEAVETPFVKWKMGGRRGQHSAYVYRYGAVIDAPEREVAWQAVASRYPDAAELFVRERSAGFWPPGVAAAAANQVEGSAA